MVCGRDSGGLGGILASGCDASGLGRILASGRDSSGAGGGIVAFGHDSSRAGAGIEDFGRVHAVARFLGGTLGCNSCKAFRFVLLLA